MTLYDRLSDLPLTIEGFAFDRHERETSSDFTRTTTVLTLRGAGENGYGEDVTYETAEHDALCETNPAFPLNGEHTIDEFSHLVDDIDLFFDREIDPVSRAYRRWAFESAALDLALKQARTDLAAVLQRSYDPVRFVASTGLGDPPSFDRIEELLEANGELSFKLDPIADWSNDLIDRLAASECVRIMDLKGNYSREFAPSPDPDLYRRIIATFPDAIIEDPAFTDETSHLFSGHEDRLSWDAPIHGIEDIEALPVEPSVLNIKPSRFGSLSSLLETIEYCLDREITMYGGGQFELDVGREHIHAIASLFYPDGPNDVAPGIYNEPDPTGELPRSPLSPPSDPVGLHWR